MILRLGPLCISWGKKIFVQQNYVVVEEDFVVKIPKVRQVEEPIDIYTPVVNQVRQEINLPVLEIVPIKHQLVQHEYIVTEKPYPITVDKPVVEEVEKVVKVQRLHYEDHPVLIPRYQVELGERTVVKMPREAIIDIRCECGFVYASNHTRCIKCGRSTEENLKVTE